MPRPRKPARLWQRRDGAWIIIDAGRQLRTGHSGESGRRAAEGSLSEYLTSREPERPAGPAQPSEIAVGAVLALYARDHGHVAGVVTLAYCIKALAGFWTGNCDSVKGSTCRAYERRRSEPVTREYVGRAGTKFSRTYTAGPGKVRRELGVLQAALHYAKKEGVLVYAPEVTLPKAPTSRDRWLTRAEAANLLWAAAPHLRRAILISLATGRRISAVLSLRWTPSLTSGWVDLDAGVIHFRGAAEQETDKRRGSVKMPRRLAAHMRRWAREGGSHVVMQRVGQKRPRYRPIAEIDTAFAAACRRAGIEDVTPHVLKHTAVTWAFQKGMTREDAADWFDTSVRTLERVYRSHSPDHQARAKAIMESR